MRDNTIINLNKINGKSVHYKGEDLVIEGFKEISTGKIIIHTHKRVLTFMENEIDDFLDQITEPKQKDFREKDLVHQNTKMLQGFTPSAENVELKASLMEMLSKVKTNPTHIEQAMAVCKIADTMVNIQKTELNMIQMLNGKEK